MRKLLSLLPLAFAAMPALALQVVPISYDMNNGAGYLDQLYSGSGCRTCAGAALSGGLGELTDGVVPTTNWNVNSTPWVGWNTSQSITFNFAPGSEIDTVIFRFDDSNSNGVAPPASVTIGGQTFAITDPVGTAPFNFIVSGLTFAGSSMPITITARGGSWMMLSEVTFQSTVPEPATALTMLVGLAGLMGAVRLKRRQSHPGLPA